MANDSYLNPSDLNNSDQIGHSFNTDHLNTEHQAITQSELNDRNKESVKKPNLLDNKRKNQTDSETIKGALGSLSLHDDLPSKSFTKKLIAFAAIAGPGLIVMIGDNDAGGVATYAQTGQTYGATLLWVVFLLIPVLMIAQEMVARLGAVTGIGHGRLIKERFSKWWALFSVIDLFALNFLTLMTEFIGISLGFSYFGIQSYLSVPISALILIVIAISGSFRRWERILYLLIAVTLVEFPLLIVSKPSLHPVLKGLFIPTVLGGWKTSAVMMIVGIVGTTIAPWQLFFQQSNVIDKRITPKWLKYERADTFVGAVITNVAAIAIMITTAFAFSHSKYFNNFTSALGVSNGLDHTIGNFAGSLFSILLIDAALLGAAAVSLSSSYAYGDVFNIRHSLHKKFSEAKGFYTSYSLQIALAAGLVLIPQMPLGLVTYSVQILAGILLPSALVFLLILCNDKELLGPWVNSFWLNVVSSVIVFSLIDLSLVITVNTVFPNVNVISILVWFALISVIAVAIVFVTLQIFGNKTSSNPENESPTKLSYSQRRQIRTELREKWSMPSLALINKPARSLTFKMTMFFMRAYLLVAVVALVIKTVKLAIG
jgi:NRAMP (natural resistance-associated macrophage protein)-like metal ion transporter